MLYFINKNDNVIATWSVGEKSPLPRLEQVLMVEMVQAGGDEKDAIFDLFIIGSFPFPRGPVTHPGYWVGDFARMIAANLPK